LSARLYLMMCCGVVEGLVDVLSACCWWSIFSRAVA